MMDCLSNADADIAWLLCLYKSLGRLPYSNAQSTAATARRMPVWLSLCVCLSISRSPVARFTC